MKQSTLMTDLEFALSLKRPHGGTGVNKLCRYIADKVQDHYYYVDFCGNIHVDLRQDPSHQTLFIAHVDTVHKDDGINSFIKTANELRSDGTSVLGADDGAGVALLLHLINHGVSAYYIFSQGEEKGGIGANYLADNDEELLLEFQRAIAFDRKGTSSIITHQGSGKCCSDEFALELANQLDESLIYGPDDTGVYTDTAEFTHVIPECTNLSVGYFSEHTTSERLDLNHFNALADSIVKVNWDSLPTVRSCADNSPSKAWSWGYTGSYTYEPPPSLDQEEWYSSKDEEVEAAMLSGALEKALEGSFNDLIECLGNYIHPDDPKIIRSTIKTRYLTLDVLSEMLEKLEKGYPVDAIYEDLFDCATGYVH